MDTQNNQGIPWMEDFGNPSTSLPEILKEEESQVGTVVIFVISAVLTITILFVIAIFIDCRQQRLIDAEDEHKRRILRFKLPKLRRHNRDDRARLTEQMAQPSTSNVIV